MTRALAILAMLLALSGCWTGHAWFEAAEAVNVIADGRYRLQSLSEPEPEGEIVRIQRQSDGSLQVGGPERSLRAIIVPLNGDASKGRYNVQLEGEDMGAHKALLLLLDTHRGRHVLSVLSCGGEAAQAARRSGGSVSRDPQAASSCVFKDRETLVASLRRQAQKRSDFTIVLQRVEE